MQIASSGAFPSALRSRRLALTAMLGAAVVWAFWWGAHEHVAPVTAADLGDAPADARYVVDASLGTLDLATIEVQPGAIVEFVLDGSAGAPHSFVLTSAAPGSEMQQTTDASGDTVIRLRIPADGSLSFICAIPGHEGLHGSLVVRTGASS
jgi:uncharacterized cupredoxin-like copper-binding protein